MDSSGISQQSNRREEEPYQSIIASAVDSSQPVLKSPVPVTGQNFLGSNPVKPKDRKRTNKKRESGLWAIFCCLSISSEKQGPPLPSAESKPVQAQARALLPPLAAQDIGKKTLVLDLDETLVHSSFKPIYNADIIIPVEIDDEIHPVYVLKRPGVDHFMKRMGDKFEIVVFTASLSKYADPLLDKLDVYNVVRSRLFREACETCDGSYVKDLSKLGRELKSVIIVDNSPASYMFQPQNAVPIGTFIDDLSDRELYELIPLLEAMINVDDVSRVLNAEG